MDIPRTGGNALCRFLFLGYGTREAVVGGPVEPADEFDTALGGLAGGVDEGIEGWNDNQGQDGGQCQAENNGDGHGAPHLARLTDPGHPHCTKIEGDARNHGEQAKDGGYSRQ